MRAAQRVSFLYPSRRHVTRSRYEKTLEEVTALLERERNDHGICKASLTEAERYSAEVEQAFKELHTRYNVQKVCELWREMCRRSSSNARTAGLREEDGSDGKGCGAAAANKRKKAVRS